MPKIFAKQKVWCSSPEHFASYKNCREEEARFNYVTLTSIDSDMLPYGWILLGQAEIVCFVDSIESGMPQALAACDKAEEKLRNELNTKLTAIDSIRQNLLALPAPKGEDDDLPF